MLQPYQLAQTYAPSPDFDQHLSTLPVEPTILCKGSGVPVRTFERMRRAGRTSRKTAQRIAAGFALVHGSMSPPAAFHLLFRPLPRAIMEPVPETRTHRRRR